MRDLDLNRGDLYGLGVGVAVMETRPILLHCTYCTFYILCTILHHLHCTILILTCLTLYYAMLCYAFFTILHCA